jgi:ribosomal protein S18 acetylase RimI-like enzyme
LKFLSRAFIPDDFPQLNRFLGEVRKDVDHNHYLHVGDLTWQLFHMLNTHRPADLIRVWQDEHGSLVGFVLVYPDFGSFDLQIHPDAKQSDLETEMLAWAQTQIRTINRNCEAHYTLVNEHATLRHTLLESHGYQRLGGWLYMQRSLSELPAAPPIPSAFTLTDMTAVDFTPRADALAAAFGAPSFPERYQRFMSASSYDPELDVVTIAPTDQVASFAMCWIDPISKVGQFEPVGTVPEFQRLGLGKATLIEGMRRLRERGMRDVIVIADAGEEPAVHLYESVGLVPRWKLFLYTRPIHSIE